MNYQKMYQSKVVTIDAALDNINSDYEIVCSLGPCEPVALFNNLHLIKDRVKRVSVVSAMIMGEYEFHTDPRMAGHFLLNSWFYSAGPRRAHPHKTVSYVPGELHNFAARRSQFRRPDIFWGSASPMDKHGYLTLSLSTVVEKDFMEKADKVILEVNPGLPRTHGDTQVHISEIDYVVETEHEIPILPPIIPGEKERAIGECVADLVEDGSTIQVGFGTISGAAACSLKNKKDIGVHTETMSDYILELYESGAISNRRKSLWKDKFVADVAMGSKRLYEFVDDNISMEFQRGKVVNDPAVIGRNYKMVSINSALQFDLTGQCTAESIDGRLYSGTGGHKEFVNGSQASEGGKSIIVMHSTSKNDTISRIVPIFAPGTAVTTSRVDVDYVITEYGVASLRGRSIRERVQELVNIAHPNFRDYLKSEARRIMLW